VLTSLFSSYKLSFLKRLQKRLYCIFQLFQPQRSGPEPRVKQS
jgi:hypothetical protein